MQLTLEDAVLERSHQPQSDLTIATHDDDDVTELAMEDIGHRVRVGNDRHGAVWFGALQQQPGIRRLGVSRRQRPLERKPPFGNEAVTGR